MSFATLFSAIIDWRDETTVPILYSCIEDTLRCAIIAKVPVDKFMSHCNEHGILVKACIPLHDIDVSMLTRLIAIRNSSIVTTFSDRVNSAPTDSTTTNTSIYISLLNTDPIEILIECYNLKKMATQVADVTKKWNILSERKTLMVGNVRSITICNCNLADGIVAKMRPEELLGGDLPRDIILSKKHNWICAIGMVVDDREEHISCILSDTLQSLFEYHTQPSTYTINMRENCVGIKVVLKGKLYTFIIQENTDSGGFSESRIDDNTTEIARNFSSQFTANWEVIDTDQEGTNISFICEEANSTHVQYTVKFVE